MEVLVFLAAVATVLCGALVAVPLVWNPRGELNQAVAVPGLLLGLWSVAVAMLLQAPDQETAWFWYRLGAVGSILDPPAILWLILTLAGTPTRRRLVLMVPFVLLNGILLYGALTSEFWYSGFHKTSLGMVGIPTNLPAWVAFYGIAAVYVWAYLFFNTWTDRPTARLQWVARTMGRGLMLSIALYMASLGCELLWGYPQVSGFAYVVMVYALGFTIFRYGLLDRQPRFAALDLLLAVDTAIAVADHEGRIVRANSAFTHRMGDQGARLEGLPLKTLLPGAEGAWNLLRQGQDEVVVDSTWGTIVLTASRDEFGDLGGASVRVRGDEDAAARNLQVVGLSDRETAIALLLSQGLSNRQIAEKMLIAPSTVRVHVSNIYGKTGASNRAELVRLVVGEAPSP